MNIEILTMKIEHEYSIFNIKIDYEYIEYGSY